MTGTQAFTLLIVLVGLERIVELVVSQRNLAWSRARGGVEVGGGHYPFMVVLHTGLLVGALVEVQLAQPALTPWWSWSMVVLVVLAQALRWWCIGTLGHRWNTRIVIVPGLPRVTSGPYRWLAHPNYVAVAIEGLALPLAGQAWITALLFTVLNALLMRVRIRAEDAALATLPSPT